MNRDLLLLAFAVFLSVGAQGSLAQQEFWEMDTARRYEAEQARQQAVSPFGANPYQQPNHNSPPAQAGSGMINSLFSGGVPLNQRWQQHQQENGQPSGYQQNYPPASSPSGHTFSGPMEKLLNMAGEKPTPNHWADFEKIENLKPEEKYKASFRWRMEEVVKEPLKKRSPFGNRFDDLEQRLHEMRPKKGSDKYFDKR